MWVAPAGCGMVAEPFKIIWDVYFIKNIPSKENAQGRDVLISNVGSNPSHLRWQ